MRATVVLVRAAGVFLLCFALTGQAHAHGGAYQPPPKPVPGRPDPGPGTGGGGGLPHGGGSDDRGPITGRPGGSVGAPSTPPGTTGGPAPPTSLPGSARRNGVGLSVVDFNSVEWARWWFANRMRLIGQPLRAGPDMRDVTPSARDLRADRMWRAEAQSVLHEALADEHRSIASAAAIALGKSGDATESESLLPVLKDQDRHITVREAAALGLGLLPVEDGAARSRVRVALEVVAQDNRESDRLRSMALYALGMRGDLAAVPVILTAATGGGRTWDVPAAGVAALGLTRCDLTIPDLVELLEGPRRRKSREAVRRAYAAHALALIGDPAVAPALRRAALGKEEHAKRAATLALGAVATPEDSKSIDVLVHNVHRSRDDATRGMALLSLGRVGGKRARDALRWAYLKGGKSLRPFGAIGLGLLARHPGFESVTGLLLHDLEHRKDPERLAAICVAIGLAGEGRAAEDLRRLVGEQRHTALQAHAAFALGLVGDRKKGAPLLRQVLRDTHDEHLRREAAMALGLMRDREAVGILAEMVRTEDVAYVQGSAALALGRIGGPEAADELMELAREKDGPRMARAMGVVGLGLLLDRQEGAQLAAIGADLSWYLFTPTVLEILTIH